MMEMELPLQTIRSRCFVWNTELPRLGLECVSPVIRIHRHDTTAYFRLCGSYDDSGKCEAWELYIKLLAKRCFTQDFGITVYFEKLNGELMNYKRQERDATYSEFLPIFTFNKNSLCQWGIGSNKLSLFFVFDSDYASDILEEKSMDDVQPGTTSLLDFSKHIEKLFDDSEHSDMVLKCDERSFYVNKCILSARSDVFAAMFRNKMSENETGVIAVEDIQPAIMEQFLRYVYSGRVDSLCMDSVFDLYKAGDKYAVPSLKQKCASFLVDNLSEDDVCQVLLLAHTFGDTELLDSAASFAADRAEFLKSEEWNTFAEEHATVAVKVLMKFVAK